MLMNYLQLNFNRFKKKSHFLVLSTLPEDFVFEIISRITNKKIHKYMSTMSVFCYNEHIINLHGYTKFNKITTMIKISKTQIACNALIQ